LPVSYNSSSATMDLACLAPGPGVVCELKALAFCLAGSLCLQPCLLADQQEGVLYMYGVVRLAVIAHGCTGPLAAGVCCGRGGTAFSPPTPFIGGGWFYGVYVYYYRLGSSAADGYQLLPPVPSQPVPATGVQPFGGRSAYSGSAFFLCGYRGSSASSITFFAVAVAGRLVPPPAAVRTYRKLTWFG